MAWFDWVGRDIRGVQLTGRMESNSAAMVADRLGETGIVPVQIEQVPNPVSVDWKAWLTPKGPKRATPLDVMMFSRQMYTLMRAGVPIMRALAALQESVVNPLFGKLIQDLRDSLDSGRELSQALAKHPSTFDTFYVSLVKVGETTGRLEEVFLRLFEHLEFQAFMRNQVKSALRYPMFVMIAMAIAIAIINLFVIPAFAKVFKGMNAELPLMTRILINFSDFTIAWWPFLLGGLIVAVAMFRVMLSTPAGRLGWDRWKLNFPIAGPIILKATLSRFSRSLALSLKSGVPIVQSLTLAAQVAENTYLAKKIEAMRAGVERGESVLRTAANTKVFTPVVLQMIMVGEESGALDDLLEEVADMYQRDIEYDLKTLAAQIEPILIIFLGVLVLVLALGVFLPMWDYGRAAIK